LPTNEKTASGSHSLPTTFGHSNAGVASIDLPMPTVLRPCIIRRDALDKNTRRDVKALGKRFDLPNV
jgi:hypothetical protein